MFLYTALLPSSTGCSRLLLHFPCPGPSTSHFSKDRQFLISENIPRNHHLGTETVHCCWSVLASSKTERGSNIHVCISVCTNTSVICSCVCVNRTPYWYLQLLHHEVHSSHPFLLVCNFSLTEETDCHHPPSITYFLLQYTQKAILELLSHIPPREMWNCLMFKSPENNYTGFWGCSPGLSSLEFPRWLHCIARLRTIGLKGQHEWVGSFLPFSLAVYFHGTETGRAGGCSLSLGKFPLPTWVWQERNYFSSGFVLRFQILWRWQVGLIFNFCPIGMYDMTRA